MQHKYFADLFNQYACNFFFLFLRYHIENLHPHLRDALDTEVLLDGRLVATEHGGPIKSTTDDDTPKTMSYCRTRIHVEEFRPSGIRIFLPNERTAARPDHPVT